MKHGINVIAPFSEPTGYGNLSCEVAYGLSLLGHDTRTIDAFWSVIRENEYNLVSKTPDMDYIDLYIMSPFDMKMRANASVMTMFEVSKAPLKWVKFVNKFAKVLTTSDFCKRGFLEAGIESQCYNVGNIVDLNLWKRCEKSKSHLFTFLYSGSFLKRKGLDTTLRAFKKFHDTNPNSRLVLKINPLDNPVPEDEIREAILKLKEGVEIIYGVSKRETLVELYSSADVILYLPRCDTIPKIVLEAGACRTPAITAAHSGITELANDQNSFLVKKFTEVPSEEVYEGVGSWYVADVDSVVEQMQYAFDNPSEIKSRGNKIRQDVEPFSLENTTKRISEVLFNDS